MSKTGPIASALEQEVKRKLRQKGIVVWLDKNGCYTGFVDGLIERWKSNDFPFPTFAFRGSYLDLMLAMEKYGDGVDPEQLLIHMPGHNEETVRKTPVLEMYVAGVQLKRAVETLVREAAAGLVEPHKVDAFVKENPGVDLEAAEAWLEQVSVKAEDDFEKYLNGLTLEWVAEGLLGARKSLKTKCADEKSLKILLDYLYRHTGMTGEFIEYFRQSPEPDFSEIADIFAAWVLCVEYVHDLKRSPVEEQLKPIRSISEPLKKNCMKLAAYYRDRHPTAYAQQAEVTEHHLHEEIASMAAEDLGVIDTFREEEERVLEGAVEALSQEQWQKASDWARLRTSAASFWLKREPARRMVWSLVSDAAEFGALLEKAGSPLEKCPSLEDALEYYVSEGHKIDRAHRWFEQQRMKLLDSTLPHFSQLLDIADTLRMLYRSWADRLAENFSAVCDREGFLPESRLQQRELYDREVHPLTQNSAKTAFFMLDAFRFEMAAELAEEFKGPGATVSLEGRFCELPSITAVGMNALAPVSRNGKLTMAGADGFTGFKKGEYTVRKPDERIRAMGDKSLDNVSSGRKQARGFALSDICGRTVDSIKRGIGGAQLIVVHGREIDEAGEANVGPAGFETLLRQIKTAWNILKSAGVTRFVFSADHGFLLRDKSSKEIPFGGKCNPQHRYILSEVPRTEENISSVSFNGLGYEGAEGYLLFPKSTAVFATGRPGASFVHGGNSLQERVIPLLTVSHRYAPYSPGVKYTISAQALPSIFGYNRIQVGVGPAPVPQMKLDFAGTHSISLALRAKGRPDIQATLKEATGAVLDKQTFQVQINQPPAEIVFDISGPRDERVRLQIYHPDEIEDVPPVTIEGYFDVAGTAREKEEFEREIAPDDDWKEAFEDQGVRKVFGHLEEHGMITEQEMVHILGSPRKVRKFAVQFETYLINVPFAVKVEPASNGKRYVREQ